MNNPATAADFYKTGHIRQYPDGTKMVYSNFTARSARLAADKVSPLFDNKTVFVGLQGVICEFLIQDWNQNFFDLPKGFVINRYKDRMDRALGPGSVSTKHIEELYELGYLPIEIKALPEGSRVNIGVPYFTVKNTLPKFYWLTNYIESALSAELWQPITVATIAYEYKRVIAHYAEVTGGNKEFTAWQAHDFSFRGMPGIHAAAKSGAAHLLVGHLGTDTIPALDYLEDYYGGVNSPMLGGSVPATEHSVMCMGGQEDEKETFRRLIQDVYPSGIISIVSDSWDFWRVITVYAEVLKEKILNRTPNALGLAKVVFRPDSGDPVKIICGDPDAHMRSPQYKGAVQCLWEIFGGTVNEKGYRTLNQRVGLIYGDSITIKRADEILDGLECKGFASDNIVFGIGSYTYQYVTRDTFGMAMKATAGIVNDEFRELFKDPITDENKTKRSARGLLIVEKDGDDFVLHDRVAPDQDENDMPENQLKTVFKNGELHRVTNVEEIRARLAIK